MNYKNISSTSRPSNTLTPSRACWTNHFQLFTPTYTQQSLAPSANTTHHGFDNFPMATSMLVAVARAAASPHSSLVRKAAFGGVPTRQRLRVSSACSPFVAVLRRLPGGRAVKASKVSSSSRGDAPALTMPPHYHKRETVQSYLQVWPRRRADFVMYGTTHNHVSSSASRAGAGNLVQGPVGRSLSRRAFSTSSSSSSAPSETADADGGQPYAAIGGGSSAAGGAGLSTKRPARPFSTTDMARKFRKGAPLTMVTA